MIDIVLMAWAGLRLSRMCKQAGVSASSHIIKLVWFWIISEILGVMLFLRLGLDIYVTAVLSVLLGCGAGLLSYRKSVAEIKALQHHNETPRLNP